MYLPPTIPRRGWTNATFLQHFSIPVAESSTSPGKHTDPVWQVIRIVDVDWEEGEEERGGKDALQIFNKRLGALLSHGRGGARWKRSALSLFMGYFRYLTKERFPNRRLTTLL